jgi:hypothetical protein
MAAGAGHDHGPAHGHTHQHDHTHGHHHGHGHGDPHDQARGTTAAEPAATLPFSLLMAGAGHRLLGVAGLLALLWLAVAWALGEPA